MPQPPLLCEEGNTQPQHLANSFTPYRPPLQFFRYQYQTVWKAAIDARRHAGALCNLQEFLRPECAQYRHRPIVLHHGTPAKARNEGANGPISDRMTMQIVHQHKPPRDSPHVFEYTHTVAVRQMVKEKRSHDHIERVIAEGQFQRVTSNRPRIACKPESFRIQI